MARSMTGYGVGTVSNEQVTVTVEVRSVNNRFLDFDFRIPKTLFSREQNIRDFVRSRVSRGRVTLRVTEEANVKSLSSINVNTELVKSYANALRNLMKEVGIEEPLSLQHLLSFGFVSSDTISEEYQNIVWECAKEALEIAMNDMISGSCKEGDNLISDIVSRMEQLRSYVEEIETLAFSQTLEYQAKLNSRLVELLSDNRIDPARLESEIAFVAEKLDITEELVRLRSHLDLLEETLKSSDQIGKTLNFILQEMGREINTIASKSWKVEIPQRAIRMKETLEQVREQVQNIE